MVRRTLLLILAAGALSAGAPQEREQRNILLLISDDQGMQAGCYGDADIRTPGIDRFAAEGVRFTHGFAAVSSCSASRSVLFSGLYTHTNGMYGLAHSFHNFASVPNLRTMPALLREKGYRTGLVAKYHVRPPEVYPFDMIATGRELMGGRNVAVMAERAKAFFAAKDDRPFLLVMGYTDPHRWGKGFGNEREFTDIEPVKYRPEDMKVPSHLPDHPDVRADLADFYESISRLDKGVELVLKALNDTGKAGNTLVIFVSDNGMPFPNAKTNVYDPGIHLPFIVRSPLQKKKGVVNHAMVSFIDVTPTILDWAGIAPPKQPYVMPGRSLLPILEQENPAGWDTVYASHTFHAVTAYYPMRMIRTRRHKLIWNLAHELKYPVALDIYNSPTWQAILRGDAERIGKRTVAAYSHRPEYELYDLEKDPDEVVNLSGDPAHAKVLRDLRTRLETMLEATHDPWLEASKR